MMLIKLFSFIWKHWLQPGDTVFEITGWNKCLLDDRVGGRKRVEFLFLGIK